MGTVASSSDEWIELYNPGAAAVDLTGWVLKAADGTPTITLSGIIQPNGYFVLERREQAISDVTANQIYSGALSDSGESLILTDASGTIIDTANFNGGPWPAGSSGFTTSCPGKCTMERRRSSSGVILPDGDFAWITNVRSTTWLKHDSRGTTSSSYLIHGTPGYNNWAYTVTPTKTATSTPLPTKTRPPTLAPQPLVGINEFVPRPAHDWNGDGKIDVGDEYIELINHGSINVNLSGWSLDDDPNTGSPPYRITSITIHPGERIVFYRSMTGISLMDNGETVRLLKPNGQVADAYTYKVAKFPDQSFCRLPDDGGLDDWNQDCFPTPGNRNSLRGTFPSQPTGGVGGPVVLPVACTLADTVLDVFVMTECPYGQNIFRPSFWDNPGWLNDTYLPQSSGKWEVFGD